ncbi:MAG: archease [Desulfobaccales bacterium]
MPGHTLKGRRPAKYRQIAHTADVAYRLQGETMAEIYVNGAEALMATITDRRLLRPRETREIEVEAPDREALLVSWLNYLLYLYDVDGFLGRDFDIVELQEERLKAQARGEIFDPERHVGKTAVKAATYHHLEITPRDHGWQATVIFDL